MLDDRRKSGCVLKQSKICTAKVRASWNSIGFFRQQGMPVFLKLKEKLCQNLSFLSVSSGINSGISFPVLLKDNICCKALHPVNLVQNNTPELSAL